MYRCRAITPPLYNTKRKNGYPTFCSAATFFGCPANYVPHFPDTRVCRPRKYRASADRENTAKTACRKRFSVACGIKSFNSLSWRSGFGGHKRRKGEICFWKIFCRNRASETAFCSFAYLYGKKRQNVTKKPFVLQKVYRAHTTNGKKSIRQAQKRLPYAGLFGAATSCNTKHF